jgi:hypothetical protein
LLCLLCNPFLGENPMVVFNADYAEQARGYAGMITDLRERTCETYVQGEASAGIAFGTVVAEGTASAVVGTPDKAINMVDASSVIAGVVVHAHNYDRLTQLDTNGAVLPKNLVTVMKMGQIYAVHEGSCTKGAVAFVRYAANGAGKTVIGAVRADADTAHALVCRGLTFGETKASVGDGIVLLNVAIDAGNGMAGLT